MTLFNPSVLILTCYSGSQTTPEIILDQYIKNTICIYIYTQLSNQYKNMIGGKCSTCVQKPQWNNTCSKAISGIVKELCNFF